MGRIEHSGEAVRKLLDVLKLAVSMEASDVHLTAGLPPCLRVCGRVRRVEGPELGASELEEVVSSLLTEKQAAEIREFGQTDFARSFEGLGRFRFNVYRQRGLVALAVRVIPSIIRGFEELGLPPSVKQLARCPNGLVLVVGPAGSGKSTTLAAMVDLVNSEFPKHIITIEDPIEYVHLHKVGIVEQREVGNDVASFCLALRAALREAPDVIMIGEMRDLDTMATALTAAETGHLVLGSLHTIDAQHTVHRMIDAFPASQQNQVRLQLAAALRGVVAQRLLGTADGLRRVVVAEVLLGTPAVSALIREGKVHQIPSVIQTGGRFGMVSFGASLRSLLDSGLVSREEAMMVFPEAFEFGLAGGDDREGPP